MFRSFIDLDLVPVDDREDIERELSFESVFSERWKSCGSEAHPRGPSPFKAHGSRG